MRMIAIRFLSVVLQIDPVTAQVGISEAEQVLCNGQVNVAQVITVGLGLASIHGWQRMKSNR